MTTRKLLVACLLIGGLRIGGDRATYALDRPQAGAQLPAVGAAPSDAAPPAVPPGANEKRRELGPVWSAVYAPDGLTLATGSGGDASAGTLALWDIPTGKVRLWLKQPIGVRGVVFSPDGKRVAAAGWDKTVRLYEVRTGKLHAVLRGHGGAINGLAFSADGKTLASCSLDKTIFLWDAEKRIERHRLAGHQDWVLCVAFSVDGKFLASSGKDGTIRLWDTETGKLLQMIKLPAPLECVAVSPDGRTLATGGWDRTVRLWDVAKGTQRAVLRGHTLGVLSVDFSPDGQTLASASGNWNRLVGGEVKLWSLPAGEERATLKGHTNSIWSVRFAPDGRTLASAGRDQQVKIWEVATGRECLTLANAIDLDAAARAEPLTSKELDAIWKALAEPDAIQGYRALRRLVRVPRQAVPWLAERLKPAAKAGGIDEKRLRELIAQLDDDTFATREKASAELAKLGPAVAPALRKALGEASSVEARLRLGDLLKKLGVSTIRPEQLRELRSIQALELINTMEARRLLQKLAEGAPDAFLTREAAVSCRRLAKRP